VERVWRREGLKVPHKQPKRGRLWLTDGSCIRLRAEHANHVWSYDFVEDRIHDGRKYRMLNVVDEFTHECLAIRINRKLKAIDVIDVLSDLFILRGVPGHIRSDNGPEFVANAVQEWIAALGAKTAYIELGSPWENGYIESFNARLRDELLNGEIFYTLREAQVIIESWRRHPTPMTLSNMRANGVRTLTLKRASSHRPGGPWSDDDYDVYTGERHIGRIIRHPRVKIRCNF
jgi:putative transposase